MGQQPADIGWLEGVLRRQDEAGGMHAGALAFVHYAMSGGIDARFTRQPSPAQRDVKVGIYTPRHASSPITCVLVYPGTATARTGIVKDMLVRESLLHPRDDIERAPFHSLERICMVPDGCHPFVDPAYLAATAALRGAPEAHLIVDKGFADSSDPYRFNVYAAGKDRPLGYLEMLPRDYVGAMRHLSGERARIAVLDFAKLR